MKRTTGTAQRKRAAFLAALEKCGSIVAACKVAKLPRRTAYEWKEADAEFAAAWAKAYELGTDALEDEAVRRGHEGVLKPVFHQGRKVGTVREFSDNLLMFTLKARRPEKFRDRFDVNHSGRLTLEQLLTGQADG